MSQASKFPNTPEGWAAYEAAMEEYHKGLAAKGDWASLRDSVRTQENRPASVAKTAAAPMSAKKKGESIGFILSLGILGWLFLGHHSTHYEFNRQVTSAYFVGMSDDHGVQTEDAPKDFPAGYVVTDYRSDDSGTNCAVAVETHKLTHGNELKFYAKVPCSAISSVRDK